MNETDDFQCPVAQQQITKAVCALLEICNKSSNKEALLSDSPRINLVIAAHRIPSKKGKVVLIKLPHALYNAQSEICVFAKDIDKKDVEVSEEYYRSLFSETLGFIPKVIPLLSLRRDFKSFEAKRRLCDSHDLFITDDTVKHRLPRLLCKHFYAKKKQPLKVDLKSKRWKHDFVSLMASTRWIISGRGDASMIHAAYSNFSQDDIVENIMACLNSVATNMIRGWSNVRSVYIKTDDSLSLPIYVSAKEPDDIDVKDEEELLYIEKKQAQRKRDDFYAPKVMKSRGSLKSRTKRKEWMKKAAKESRKQSTKS